MKRPRLLLAVVALTFGFTGAAQAVPLPFSATLTLQLGIGGGTVLSASGAGVGDSAGAGGTASIPAGALPLQLTQPLSPPVLSLLYGFAVAGPAQVNMKAPLKAGSNQALAFNGAIGAMGLNASAYVLNKAAKAVGAIPLALLGAATGVSTLSGLIGGVISSTFSHNRYKLGVITVSGGLAPGPPTVFMATGFDARTLGGAGTLQLVTPAVYSVGALGSIPILSTLSITYTPEPGTAILLAAGVAALSAMARRHRIA